MRSASKQSACVQTHTALRMWTENVTWFSNEEGKKGRIEVGELADRIVPDRDYFSCPGAEIADITSHLTIVGGKMVYAAGDFKQLDRPLPPAMPDWSPVRSYGGYGAWAAARARIDATPVRPKLRLYAKLRHPRSRSRERLVEPFAGR